MTIQYVAWMASAMLLVLSGCSPEPDGHTSRLRLFQEPRPGLSLQIALSADTVAAGDSAGLYLQYYVVSGASSSRFDNSPGMFASQVERESGELVNPEFVTHPLNRMVGNTVVRIPARGALGQVINLRCIQDAAGYGGDPLNPDVCLGFYKFDRPGRYRVILLYEGPDLARSAERDADIEATGLSADADSLPLLHLADTASLVVR